MSLKSARERTSERYDTSQLTDANRGNVVNRDYLAHCLRWGWATRFCSGKRVLDVGCGEGTPLAKVLRYMPSTAPDYYLGVDVKRVEDRARNEWCEVLDEFDFVERWPELAAALDAENPRFDVAVSFESIEHMSEADGRRLLAGARALLASDGVLLLSTPVANGRPAKAHVHEWAADELRGAIGAAGFHAVRRHGTFSSYPEMRAHLLALGACPGTDAAADLRALDRLRAYYSDDVAACFLAPLYPEASRNCAWVCKPLVAGMVAYS